MAKRGRTKREALARAMKGAHVKVLKNVNGIIREHDVLEKKGGYYVRKGEKMGSHKVRIPILWGLFHWSISSPNYLLAGAVESSPKMFQIL